MTYSPWGPIQHTQEVVDGISYVHTAGHGGLRVNRIIAEGLLTKEALKRGIKKANFYFWEEDCDYSIPVYELERFHEDFFDD